MEYTSRKKRGSRIGVRIVGCAFVTFAVLYIMYSLCKGEFMGHMVSLILFFVLGVVGCKYIKESFAITAYDITYCITPQQLSLKTYRGEKIISYNDIAKVELSEVSKEMEYYIVHILARQYNLVIHINGDKKTAQNMYQLLLEYTGRRDEEVGTSK